MWEESCVDGEYLQTCETLFRNTKFRRSVSISDDCKMLTLVAATASAFQHAPLRSPVSSRSAVTGVSMSEDNPRRVFLQQGSAAACAAALSLSAPATQQAFAAGKPSEAEWEVVKLPLATDSPILFDIEFDTEKPNNGWIVGNRGTFLQTTDGGKSWSAKSFANLDPDEEINYRFTKISFKDGEGYIIGKPAILLHTRDSGASWERVPLSPSKQQDSNTQPSVLESANQ